MPLPASGSQRFHKHFWNSTRVLWCVLVFLLCGVFPPSLWPSSTLAVRLVSFIITKSAFRDAPSETREKNEAFRKLEGFVIFSQSANQKHKRTSLLSNSARSKTSIETRTETHTTETQRRRTTDTSFPSPFTRLWRRLVGFGRTASAAGGARIRLLWRNCRRKIATVASSISRRIAAAMSGGLPSSRSLEGRCFLNLEADRPPPPPFMHLSASTHEIEPRAQSLLQQRLDETARCLKSAGRARASSAKKEPFVYVGAPGIAFSFLKLISIVTGDRLKSALDCVESFLSPDIVEAGLEEGRIYQQLEPSLLSGPAGVCVVRALRAMQQEQLKMVERGVCPRPPLLVHVPEEVKDSGVQEKGDDEKGSDDQRCHAPTPLSVEFKKAVHQYEKYGEAALEPETVDEWLYGRAGYLYGALFLDYLSPGCIDESLINSVASKIIASGKRRAEESGRTRPPLRFAWHKKEYVGAAHGYFGILHMLLHVRHVRRDKVALAMIRDTLDWLLELETSKHNWPAVVGDHDAHLCHFCHGATGAVLVYSKAATVFQDSTYRQAAERAADCVWRYGLLKKGAGICHGIGGSGYSLLAVYQLTQDPKWLDRAVEHSIKAFDEKIQADSRVPDNPYSLFEGVAGAMCLLIDLLKNPKSAAFPFFQIGF